MGINLSSSNKWPELPQPTIESVKTEIDAYLDDYIEFITLYEIFGDIEYVDLAEYTLFAIEKKHCKLLYVQDLTIRKKKGLI